MLAEKSNMQKSGFSVMKAEELFEINGGGSEEQVLKPYEPKEEKPTFAQEHPVAWVAGHIIAEIAFIGHEPCAEKEMAAEGYAMALAKKDKTSDSSSNQSGNSSSGPSGSSPSK